VVELEAFLRGAPDTDAVTREHLSAHGERNVAPFVLARPGASKSQRFNGH
jgi:hypothetical protein